MENLSPVRKNNRNDTIVAIATPPGFGGVGIVRVSGPLVVDIARRLLGSCPQPRLAQFSAFRDEGGQAVDQGIALYFKAPHSFTGEDVLELQAHGGPVILDQLVKATLAFGARPAEPGEFSRQAFLNDKLDLAQAEAIADLIHAQSEQAARSALSSLQGVFSEYIETLAQHMVQARLQVEAGIDFADEDIDIEESTKVVAVCQQMASEIDAMIADTQQGVLLREGVQVVIAGRPNAGKSSLLNRLSGEDCAIVTDLPGTTRDVLKQTIHLDGLPLHIIDTAGLRETQDVVESEGIRRAWQAIENADFVLYMVDLSREDLSLAAISAELAAFSTLKAPIILVANKADLVTESGIDWQQVPNVAASLCLSVKAEQGWQQLIDTIKQQVGFEQSGEGRFMARRRHLEALKQARLHLQEGMDAFALHGASELLAEDLRHAHEALCQITGRFTADDLLGEIFSSFCIGK